MKLGVGDEMSLDKEDFMRVAEERRVSSHKLRLRDRKALSEGSILTVVRCSRVWTLNLKVVTIAHYLSQEIPGETYGRSPFTGILSTQVAGALNSSLTVNRQQQTHITVDRL
jgi:hypothetical protein